MKAVLLSCSLVLGLALTVVATVAQTSAVPASALQWRQIIDEKIRAIPYEKVNELRPADLSPLLLHASPDTEVVTLAPYRVEGHRIEAEIQRRYLIAVKREKNEKVLRNVGIGMHVLGKGPLQAGVLTVFWVPVYAAVSLSW